MTKFIVAPSRSVLATSFLAFLYICLPSSSFIIPKVTSRGEKIKFNPSITSGTAEALFRRGGGSPFLEGHGYSDVDFDYRDDDEIGKEVEVDIITGAQEIGAAKLAKPMSKFPMNDEKREQQSKSYFLSSVLWLSLALDTILNKKKRSLLFSGASDVGGRIIASNVVPTFSLASGFVLSAGVAFLLSCDLKDNSFTHCSAETNGSEFNEKVRKRLHLFLATFGIVNVGANLNSSSAPFLGAGGGAINFYNALIAVNGWSKEVGGGDKNFLMQVIGGFKSIINSFVTSFDSGENPGFSRRMSSVVYFLGSVIAILRSFNLISNVLVPHYMKCYTAGTVSNPYETIFADDFLLVLLLTFHLHVETFSCILPWHS